MVNDEQRAELQRLAQDYEAKVRMYMEWEARVRLYMEASEDSIAAGELVEYLEEESRG